MKKLNYEKIARKRWPGAEWYSGSGPFALIAPCGVMTVSLHETMTAALVVKEQIDSGGCGSHCTPLRTGSHQIFNLDDNPARSVNALPPP